MKKQMLWIVVKITRSDFLLYHCPWGNLSLWFEIQKSTEKIAENYEKKFWNLIQFYSKVGCWLEQSVLIILQPRSFLRWVTESLFWISYEWYGINNWVSEFILSWIMFSWSFYQQHYKGLRIFLHLENFKCNELYSFCLSFFVC